MSVVENTSGGGSYGTGKVNFGWIGEAWRFFTQAAGIWIVGIIVYYAISVGVRLTLRSFFPGPELPVGTNPVLDALTHSPLGFMFKQTAPIGALIGFVFGLLLNSFQSASLYRMALRQIKGERVQFSDLVSGGPYFANMLLYNVMLTILLLVGCAGICIGMFVVFGLLLPGAAMVVDGETAPSALSRSFEVMKRDWLNATAFAFVFFLLYLVSLLPALLGILAVWPMYYLVSALAYRDMVTLPMPPTGPFYGGETPHGVWPPSPSQSPNNDPPSLSS